MDFEMDLAGGPWSPTGKTPAGEGCVHATQEEPPVPADVSSGPGASEDRRNEIKEPGWDVVSLHHVDAITGEATPHVIVDSCLDGSGNFLRNPVDNREEDKGPLNPEAVRPTHTDAQGNICSRTDRQDHSKLDVGVMKAHFEGRLEAACQEASQFKAELKAVFQSYESESQELKQLVFEKEDQISKQQGDIQTLSELNTELMERQERIKHDMQEAKNVPCLCEDSLVTEIEKTFGYLYREKRTVDKDFRNCRSQLHLATADIALKNREREQLAENIMVLEEAKSKLEQKLDKIQQELCKEKEGHHGSYVDGSQTPFLLENTAKDMFLSIATFCAVLSRYKDSNGANPAHDLIAGGQCCKEMVIERNHHWTYLLKNFISNDLFRGFEYETLSSVNSNVLFLDQEERVKTCSKYFQDSKNGACRDRAPASYPKAHGFDILFFYYFSSLRLLPSDINHLRASILDYDDLIGTAFNKLHLDFPADKRRVLVGLIIAAKKVWDFHQLCLSFNPPATIFRVSAGDPFNAEYMEVVDVPENDGGNTVQTVAFMVFPGFRLRKSIIKCQVYLKIKT